MSYGTLAMLKWLSIAIVAAIGVEREDACAEGTECSALDELQLLQTELNRVSLHSFQDALFSKTAEQEAAGKLSTNTANAQVSVLAKDGVYAGPFTRKKAEADVKTAAEAKAKVAPVKTETFTPAGIFSLLKVKSQAEAMTEPVSKKKEELIKAATHAELQKVAAEVEAPSAGVGESTDCWKEWVKIAMISTLIILVFTVVCVSSREASSAPEKQSVYSSVALCQMQAFRLYAGFFVMTWLPYLIAQEGERMWGHHQAAFMSTCKMIFGLTIAATPVLGALNDRTRLRFGRRRTWLVVGIVLIIAGLCGTALSSLCRMNSAFFLCLTLWMFGEAACESTSEALVPDLCSKEDYARAGGFKSSLFMLGGVLGYVLIIICSYVLGLHFYWMYVAFMLFILMTVPFVFAYAAPTEAEVKNFDTVAAGEEPILQSLWYAYVFPLEGPESRDFLKAMMTSLFACAGCSSVLFVSLCCRDILRIEAPEMVQLHFACISLNYAAFAVVGAAVATYWSDLAARLYWCKFVAVLYGVTELFFPACGLLSSPTVAFYSTASIKGFLYGCMVTAIMSIHWDVLPRKLKEPDEYGHDHVGTAMALASVTRSLGAGLGTVPCGMVLQFAFSSSPLPSDAGTFHYPLQAYAAMFSFSALMMLIGARILHTIRLPDSN